MTNDLVRAVCPHCYGHLEFAAQRITCRSCGTQFEYRQGFPDLIVGARFDDQLGDLQTRYEEQSNEWLAERYLIPTLSKMLAGIKRPRVLSLGCGTGVDIDRLSQHGFDIVGIDCGNRTNVWPRREQRQRLCLANGMRLPFETGSFDAVYCGCVFPHVGVDGDSHHVTPDYHEQRAAIAREMGRVLKRGGHAVVSSPNRLFPIDIFHGRSPDQPFPRINPPWSPFLLSAGDYRRLFAAAGCRDSRLLPVKDYWGFIRMKQKRSGRLMAWPVETVFSLVSKPAFRALRGSPISPWLVMAAEKTHAA